MKRLILMRHAKSAWASPDQRDIDRPLNKRGIRSSALIGKWLVANRYIPDLALVSSARRTRETMSGVSKVIGEIPTEFVADLYHSSAATLRDTLEKAGAADSVLMIVHLPGVGDFARHAVVDAPEGKEFYHYPTAATAIIDFAFSDWEEFSWQTGNLVDFIVPRALEQTL